MQTTHTRKGRQAGTHCELRVHLLEDLKFLRAARQHPVQLLVAGRQVLGALQPVLVLRAEGGKGKSE